MPTGVYHRRYRSKITPEMRAEIMTDIEAGNQTYVELGKKYKCHPTTLQKIKKAEEQKLKNNTPLVPVSDVPESPSKQFGHGKYAHLTPQMQALRAENLSYRAIGEKLGMGTAAGNMVAYYLNSKKRLGLQSDNGGVHTNGHEQLDTRFLVGFGCAELERTLTTIAQRLGIAPNLLRQGFSKFLGSAALR